MNFYAYLNIDCSVCMGTFGESHLVGMPRSYQVHSTPFAIIVSVGNVIFFFFFYLRSLCSFEQIQ